MGNYMEENEERGSGESQLITCLAKFSRQGFGGITVEVSFKEGQVGAVRIVSGRFFPCIRGSVGKSTKIFKGKLTYGVEGRDVGGEKVEIDVLLSY